MRRRHGAVPLALLALCVAAACSHKKPEVVPPTDTGPGPTTPTSAPPAPPPAAPGNMGGSEAAVTARLVAEVGNVIHFDLDQDVIKPEDRPVLDRKADILRANPALRIRVSGHADERGSDEYNLVLGNKRALAAKQYLVSKGIDASRIDVTSLGEERPVDPASNETAWAKNRRDEVEIISGGDRLVAPR
ncbi:MAG TPA: OmpA family protein [Gemmatimonadales bacterium]|nr:OmpA family protein [Gemmatimonadales bacterium]